MTSDRLGLLRELHADRWLAHSTIFHRRHPEASAPAHREIVRAIYRPDPRVSIEGFRGIAKSTLLEEAAVLRGAFREFRNMLVVGSSYSRACDRLASIKREFTINDYLIDLFGPLQGDVWQEGKIVLANGACIQALGRDQSMLGIKHFDWRPDAALVDDVEDADEVRTDAERAQTWDWFMKTFLPSLDHPLYSWVRVLGTRRGNGSLPERIEKEGWPCARFPIEYLDEEGERQATWPAKFPLSVVDTLRHQYRGDMDTYMQEYMCQPMSAADRVFRREQIRVVPRPRSWEAVYAMYDPARTVGMKSATTGKAVWSWRNRRLIVWDATAELWLPDRLIADIFETNRKYRPVWIGVEEDGLNEWIRQPLRHEQVRRGVALPLRPLRAPKGKLDFIRGLQPFFEAGEVEFAQALPDLEAQLLSFPHGKIDAPNALAYALQMRPGIPVYDFAEENIADGIAPHEGRPLYIAGNSDGRVTTAALVQRALGVLLVLADWVREGVPAEVVADIHREAALMAEGGEWVERLEYGEGEEQFKLPVRVTGWSRYPVHWVVPAAHKSQYMNVGLIQAIRAIPESVSAGDGKEAGLDLRRGRAELARLLGERRRGTPSLLVSPHAGWTLRAFSGGYARPVGSSALVEAEAERGIYRTLMEGLESFAGIGVGMERQATDTEQPLAYNRAGMAYRSALPTGRLH